MFYDVGSMPKIFRAVDCLKIAAAIVAVNTSAGLEGRGPPAAPLDSA